MFSKIISKPRIFISRNRLFVSANLVTFRIETRRSHGNLLIKLTNSSPLNSRPRFLCVNSKSESATSDATKKESKALLESEDFDDYEEPKTAGQKVAAYGMLALRLSFMVVGLVCVGFTVRELFPGRMSPNALFNEAFEVLRENEEIISLVGEEMRAFGRDVGRSTEGRRNQVDSRTYTDDHGHRRTRVRFHVKGPKGKVVVYAEVSSLSPSNEFAYLICQDTRTGRVVTVQDNRAKMELEASSTSSETRNAMQSLLGMSAKK